MRVFICLTLCVLCVSMCVCECVLTGKDFPVVICRISLFLIFVNDRLVRHVIIRYVFLPNIQDKYLYL